MMGQGYTFYGICKGITKAGTRCRHTVVFANSYCRQHGGDSTDYMLERARQIAAKRRARLERLKLRLSREK